MTAIECTELSKQYEGGTLALTDLDLEVEEGTVFGFLGPNGAGKTTTVRILNGTLRPTAGSFRIFSEEPDGESIRKKSATLSETANMYEHLTGMENMLFFGSLYGMGRTEIVSRARELFGRLGIAGREHHKVGTWSTGMKKRLQLARTLLHRPKLLFLDEPASGLDPEGANEVTELIRGLAAEEGTTIFLCTHNLTIAERLCGKVGFLEKGRLIASGTKEELARRLGRERRLVMTLLDPSSGEKKRVEIPVEGPGELNGHIRSAMERGYTVLESGMPEPGLEEMYFAYLGEKR